MGEKGKPTEIVFKGLEYSYTQTFLPKWLTKAGITKDLLSIALDIPMQHYN